MYGYVDLVDRRHIVARNLSSTGITAKNVHCQTAAEAEAVYEGMKRNLAGGFTIIPTHSSGFKYIKTAELGKAAGSTS